MTYVEWPQGVNKKFYGRKATPEDNAEVTEYASGRKIKRLKNTRFIFTFTCSLSVECPIELNTFWEWYTNTLGGTAGVFKCSELKRTPQSTEYFRFNTPPAEGDGQSTKALDFEIEEIY